MSYFVQQNATSYDIVEKDTNEVVFTYSGKTIADKMCRSLNLGSGFNGYTPSFFCISYKDISK